MKRSILITTLRNPSTGESKTLCGGYRPVSEARAGYTQVESSEIRHYEMTDAEFVEHATKSQNN